MPFYGFHDQIRFFNTTKGAWAGVSIVVYPKSHSSRGFTDSSLIGISSRKVIKLLIHTLC
jgi:hypothetical protein